MGFEETTFEENWWSFRFPNKMPERRAYHSSFQWKGKYFMFGGKDISMGHLNSLWSIDLNEVGKLESGVSERTQNPEWVQYNLEGKKSNALWPNPVANHTSVVFKDKMYLFGGSSGMCENEDLYAYDLNNNSWSKINSKPKNNDERNVVVSRDEHSAVVLHDSMVIFGGFS